MGDIEQRDTVGGLLPPYSVRWVTFFCTDRGQHPRTEFGTVRDLTGKPPYRWFPVTHPLVGIEQKRGLYLEDRCVHIRCPRCAPRHVRWHIDKAHAIVDRLIAAGRSELDISLV